MKEYPMNPWRKKITYGILFLAGSAIIFHCKKQTLPGAAMAGSTSPWEFQLQQDKITFKVNQIFYNDEENKPLAFEEAKLVLQQTAAVISAIIKKDLKPIIQQITESEKVFIDLKAGVDKKTAVESLKDGLLQKVYWQKINNEYPSYQNIFAKVNEIQVDFFFENLKEVEIFLKFDNRPPQGVIGNLIYHKNSEGWKIKQFF